MERHAWFARLTADIVDKLPEPADEVVRLLERVNTPEPAGAPDLGPASLVAFIASQYHHGNHPDEIAQHMTTSGVWPPEIEPLASVGALVAPVCNMFRSTDLRFDYWWDADGCFVTLLSWYMRFRLPAENEESITKELDALWRIPALGIPAILARAQAPLDVPLAAFPDIAARLEIGDHAHATKNERYRAALAERDDLMRLSARLEQLRRVGSSLRSAVERGRDVAAERAILEDVWHNFETATASLSPYEESLLLSSRA